MLCFLHGSLNAQVPQNVKAREINVPYFEGTQLKAFFYGKDAKPITGGKGELLVNDFEMRWFGSTTNEVELIGKAPQCFFNYSTKTAWGTNQIEVFDGSTNYFIEGKGFTCRQTRTNAVLVISNDVHSVLKRDSEKTNKVAATEPPLRIVSGHFEFISQTENGKTKKRVATYTEDVRVDDPEIKLTCGLLTIDLPVVSNDEKAGTNDVKAGTKQVRNIVAEQNVVIQTSFDPTRTNRSNARATGERAVYFRGEEEIITLHGNPGWQDGESVGKADVLVFNKTQKTVRAEKNASLKLPRGTLASVELPGAATNRVADLNQFVEITSDLLVIGLPTTNRTTRSLTAEKNVVILSPADQSRATADHADFVEAQGVLRLAGAAQWETDRMIARGDNIWLNSSNRIFGARSRGSNPAYLRMLDTGAAKTGSGTNQFIEITCNDFEVNTNLAAFHSGSGEHLGIARVNTKFFESGTPSDLVSEKLDVYFISNQVERVVALGSVVLTQQPDTTRTNFSRKDLSCHKLTLDRSPETGFTRGIIAQDKVKFAQLERKGDKLTTNQLAAQILTLTFSDKTNQLTGFVAEHDVEMKQDVNHITGQQVVYIVDKDLVEVTGTPLLRTDKVMWKDAEILYFRPNNGEVWSTGPFKVTPLDPSTSPKEFLK